MVALLLAAASPLPAHATDPVVLKNNQITESALIDALSIEAPDATGGTVRGFKPAAPGAATPAAPPKAAGPGRANLLITFETNSASLSDDSQAALDAVGKALQSDALAGLTFRVEGHADSRGDAEANRTLSQMRAEAVVKYLVGKHGVLPERLQPQGKGSDEPLNKARVDAPENRRVTIVTVRG
jgi:outer membrane protein OmpA-like peptidoglycan-associated protein